MGTYKIRLLHLLSRYHSTYTFTTASTPLFSLEFFTLNSPQGSSKLTAQHLQAETRANTRTLATLSPLSPLPLCIRFIIRNTPNFMGLYAVLYLLPCFFYLLSSPNRSQHDENNDISGVKPENKTKYPEKKQPKRRRTINGRQNRNLYILLFNFSGNFA